MRYLSIIVLFALLSCEAPTTTNEKQPAAVTLGSAESIYSNILEEEREIWVYVPEAFYGYNAEVASYPVVYVMDAEFQFKSTVGIFDQLNSAANATDAMPACIVVGITNTNRTRDLTPTGYLPCLPSILP